MADARLLVRVRTASYAVHGGFPVIISHVGDCLNQAGDEELVRCVRGANPKIMNELMAGAKAVMGGHGVPSRVQN